ncbi:tRNA glutamyl-Q(34) synthetase GluQRS [Aliiglaciecola sp. M165]|uniref:tRNA glutamyl-Q(34) synthetase GluQRS n=1 Tax=Aliiglaciecola sp. M165 TaxID=2593649 RepID=UPI0021B134DD|nr:tRNA glutamyl-Q(34) synthetase GluQRS [Aliiglaciecola sp. M165]
MSNHNPYIGRFAPSPSGPLHLGSLVTALGSFLQAKTRRGMWRLRIDDIDPPRIMSGATESILSSLTAHGLHWDGDVVFQSQHSKLYDETLDFLQDNHLLYPCDCTRAQTKALGPVYTGVCRNKKSVNTPFALRFKNNVKIETLDDEYLGKVAVDVSQTQEDFIVKRKDGLYAYHLASVVDDIEMGVTQIVRGEDLLLPSACQLALFKTLNVSPPSNLHLPLVKFADGRKFSKQNHAPALDNSKASANLLAALEYLNLPVKTQSKLLEVDQILDWAIDNWSI